MPDLTQMGYFTWKPGGEAGTVKYGVMLPLKYTDIAPDLGFTKENSEADASAIKTTTGMACRNGQLLRLRMNYRTGTGKRGSADIVCAPGNVDTAFNNLSGKAYGAGTVITSVKGRPKQDFR